MVVAVSAMASKLVLLIFCPVISTGFEVEFVPYVDFIADLQNSTYAGVRSRNSASSFKVRSEAAFEEMRRYILSLYEGVNVSHSFLRVHHFDCVVVETQPSLRGRKPAKPPAAPSVPNFRATPVLQDGPCTAGTVPMMRLSLQRVLRHATLGHFLAKSPHGPSRLPARSATQVGSDYAPHKYAHAYQNVDNGGGSSDLGIWNPDGDFTLSQQWYVAYTQAGAVQTAECGNVRFSGFGPEAVLFLYHTNNGYVEGSGCYNLDCPGFVQTDHTVYLGHSWSSYSSDGNRVSAGFSFQLFQGNWWFALSGTYVGYYPSSVYSSVDATAMAVRATEVDFGGETTHDGTDGWPEMGSGRFADAGWTHAAGHSTVRYFTPDGKSSVDATLTSDADYQSCYTIEYHENNPDLGTYFTFGGPGGPASGCNSLAVVV